MMASPIHEVVQRWRRTVIQQDGAGLSDGQLLSRFIEQRDEAAAAALVRRHGPMVWGVCRRILRNPRDAEDAFQATFLVLVRRAASISPREMVGNWLYGVAHQTALKARAMMAKRRVREKQVTAMPELRVEQQDQQEDLQAVLDQELSRLPDKYRAAIVLCDLEGKTRKEAAQQLGVPDGTLAARLARARTMLGKRLARQGLAVSGGALAATVLQNEATASVPTSVVSSTIKAVSLFAAGKAPATAAASVKVAALTYGVLKGMLLNKIKTATIVLLVVTLVGMAAGGLLHYTRAAEEPRAERTGPPAPGTGQPAARKPVSNGNGHKWIVGNWRSYKVDYSAIGGWPFGPFDAEAQIELVATSPHEIGVFLISADGKRTRAADSQPSIMDDKRLFFGPIGSGLSFRYRRSRADVLILDLETEGSAIHAELRRDPGFTQRQTERIEKGMSVDDVTAALGCPPGDYTAGKGCYIAFIDPFPVDAFRRQFPIHWCGRQGAIGLVLDETGKVRHAEWYPTLDSDNIRTDPPALEEEK
jgi:RNA polymerase sigma factor (sigma-70 family)